LRVTNLDGGKEIVVSGGGQSTDGAVNDAHTGAQLSVDDFEQFVGCPPLMKQLIRRTQSQPLTANKDGGKPPVKKKPRWLKNIKLVATAAGLIHEKDRDRPSSLPSAVTMSKSKSAPASASAVEIGTATPPPVPSSSSERLKVHHSGKSSKDLTGLYMRQEVRAHEGSIWSIKFSSDGRFLATGGEDRVVRVWQVVDADASSSSPELFTAKLPPLAPTDGGSLAAAPGLAAQLSRKVRRGKSGKHVLPEHVVVPDTLFALAERPACVFEGHVDDVLDLSWSRQSPRLLSSSMDKTVRLWDVEGKSCLKVFAHSDYVTCIQFNPADDGYFISGSLDCKVRIWSVADRQVVDYSDLTDMVTAACYTPDGQVRSLNFGSFDPTQSSSDAIDPHLKSLIDDLHCSNLIFS
jgi:WD40 repeat protein